MSDLLGLSLDVAVPVAQEELGRMSWAEVERVAAEAVDVVASKGDLILYRSTRPGETSAAFVALARGLAALSFAPGGVSFLGRHWDAEHPELALGPSSDPSGGRS